MNKRWLGISIAIFLIIIILLVKNYKNITTSTRSTQGETLAGLLSSAKDLQDRHNLQAARSVYQRLVSEFSNSAQVSQWQKKIEDLNIKLLFSNQITKGSILYEIKPQDTLSRIAKQFNTTVELLMKSNNLKSDKIFPGKKLKVYNQPFSVVVDKSQNMLILKSNEEIIKTYIVSTGINNSTPTGDFKIVNKLVKPTWYKAGAVVPPDSPENILGSCWLGFDLTGYGIHGTKDPQSLGKYITQGCIRMSNQNVQELYTILPVGTEVTIID